MCFNGAISYVRICAFGGDLGLRIYLDETNVGGLFTETLTADVETVFADETGLVGADTAVKFSSASCSLVVSSYSIIPALTHPISSISEYNLDYEESIKRTKRGLPFRRYGDESSRRTRET